MIQKHFISSCTAFLTFLLAALNILGQCASPQFNAPIDLQFGAFASDVATGDLNGDSRADAVVPVFILNEVHIFFGSQPNAPTRTKLTSIQSPISAGIGDFNHDGKMDLAISRFITGVSSLSVLLGDGAGGFSAPTDFTTSLTRPLVIADFNNDTNPDVFLGSGSPGSQLLLGNGTGGFSAPVNVFNIPGNVHATAADFNKDGKIDLATVNDGSSVSIALGNGTGGFSSVTGFPVSRAKFVAAADFNNDNNLDIATAGQSDGVSILLGDGTGNFGAATSFNTGFSTNTVGVGDFNGDARADVVTTTNNQLAVFLGNGTGSLGAPSYFNPPRTAELNDLSVADLNGDGRPDVVALSGSGHVTLFFGTGDGKLQYPTLLSSGSNVFSVVAGDINADGKPDLVIGHTGNDLTSFLSDGLGGFGPPVNILTGLQSGPTALVDVTGDTKVDLITANQNNGSISILTGVGDGSFSSPLTITVPGFNPFYVVAADFNNDGRTDLVVINRSSSFVSVLLANASGGFGSATNFNVPSGGQQASTGDFNNDGNLDLAVATIPGPAVLLGNGNGTFGPSTTLATTGSVGAVAVNDYNNDGNADLAAPVSNANSDLIYLGNGAGGFAAGTPFAAGPGPDYIVSADFNSDGNADVATANGEGTASVLLGNGSGSLGSAVTFGTAGLVPRMLVTEDFNSDARPDLAVAIQGGNVIPAGGPPGIASVLINQCTTAAAIPPALSISDMSINEGDSGTSTLSFNVALSAATNKTVRASFYSAPIDATAGVDYKTILGNVVFAPGITAQTINVPVIGDSLDEFDEKFKVVLRVPLNAVMSRGESLATILDDDLPPNISVNDVTLKEGNSGTTFAFFPVFLSGPSGKPISISVTTSDDTANAGTDYTGINVTLNFIPGQVAQVVPVDIAGDTTVESNERFFVTLSNPTNVTLLDSQAIGLINNDDTSVAFSSSSFTIDEAGGSLMVNVVRLGDSTGTSTVDYTTTDTDNFTVNCATFTGNAFARCDFATSVDTLKFGPGETSKNFLIPIIDDSWAEGNETFGLALSNATGGVLGGPATAVVTINDNDSVTGTNPIFLTPFFVRQHYLDFLSREPELGEPWSPLLNGCSDVNNNPSCDRLTVSGAIFGSQEFRLKGYYNYRFYKVAFNRLPLYEEIVVDMRKVTGTTAQDTFNRKAQFANDFVLRPQFAAQYNGMSNTQYVNTLMNRYGLSAIVTTDPNNPDTGEMVTLTTKDLVDRLDGVGGTMTRAQVLRAIVESQNVLMLEFIPGFVAMQYYGYLRRIPDTAGYNGWLTYMNAHPDDFRTMVNGFMNSDEYRKRFGPNPDIP